MTWWWWWLWIWANRGGCYRLGPRVPVCKPCWNCTHKMGNPWTPITKKWTPTVFWWRSWVPCCSQWHHHQFHGKSKWSLQNQFLLRHLSSWRFCKFLSLGFFSLTPCNFENCWSSYIEIWCFHLWCRFWKKHLYAMVLCSSQILTRRSYLSSLNLYMTP